MVFFRGLTGRHASLGFPRRPVRDIVRRRFDHLGPEETRPCAGVSRLMAAGTMAEPILGSRDGRYKPHWTAEDL